MKKPAAAIAEDGSTRKDSLDLNVAHRKTPTTRMEADIWHNGKLLCGINRNTPTAYHAAAAHATTDMTNGPLGPERARKRSQELAVCEGHQNGLQA